MPHEGHADPVTNDGPGFHLNIPVSELTEHVTQAIEASDVSSAPPVVEITDGVMHETRPDPYQNQMGLGGSRRQNASAAPDPRIRELHLV